MADKPKPIEVSGFILISPGGHGAKVRSVRGRKRKPRTFIYDDARKGYVLKCHGLEEFREIQDDYHGIVNPPLKADFMSEDEADELYQAQLKAEGEQNRKIEAQKKAIEDARKLKDAGKLPQQVKAKQAEAAAKAPRPETTPSGEAPTKARRKIPTLAEKEEQEPLVLNDAPKDEGGA